MPDPIARKRLKKKMLDRWENEGGRIAADSAADDTKPTSEGKGQETKLSSQRRNSPVGNPAASTKKRKPSPK